MEALSAKWLCRRSGPGFSDPEVRSKGLADQCGTLKSNSLDSRTCSDCGLSGGQSSSAADLLFVPRNHCLTDHGSDAG